MARWRGSSAQRGYDRRHQLRRDYLLARWRPGDLCARCQQPMWGPAEDIHLGHTDDRTGYTGLEHKSCNTADGARRGNQARQFKPASAGSNVVCPICLRSYHYAARSCEMCGLHYHPSHGQQRTCSRACGINLRRRIYGPTGSSRHRKPKPAPVPRPPKPARPPRTALELLDDPAALRLAARSWRRSQRW